MLICSLKLRCQLTMKHRQKSKTRKWLWQKTQLQKMIFTKKTLSSINHTDLQLTLRTKKEFSSRSIRGTKTILQLLFKTTLTSNKRLRRSSTKRTSLQEALIPPTTPWRASSSRSTGRRSWTALPTWFPSTKQMRRTFTTSKPKSQYLSTTTLRISLATRSLVWTGANQWSTSTTQTRVFRLNLWTRTKPLRGPSKKHQTSGQWRETTMAGWTCSWIRKLSRKLFIRWSSLRMRSGTSFWPGHKLSKCNRLRARSRH